MGCLARVLDSVRSLYPGYFALVMATGIISDAFLSLDHRTLSDLLFAFNLIAFPLLLIALTARAIRFGALLWRDLVDPRLVFSFFTIVAATNVLGVQLFLRGYERTAMVMWLTALVVWLLLSYLSFGVLIFSNDRRGAGVVHGGWLIGIVGTQSLVLLGTLLAPGFGRFSSLTFVAVHALWGIGLVLYGIFVTLFSNRIFFLRVQPGEAMPLFWVIMGAAAISANAGTALILREPAVRFLSSLRPFVEGSTLVLWAWGTWWIPLFVIIGIWKHVIHKVPLTYHPMYWSLVFPLGMYSASTYRLARVAEFPSLVILARVMAWVALGAWTLTLIGWLASVVRSSPSAALPRREQWKGFLR